MKGTNEMNTRKTFVRAVAGAAIAVMALMPGEAFAFLGLFESKPTQAEMERLGIRLPARWKRRLHAVYGCCDFAG